MLERKEQEKLVLFLYAYGRHHCESLEKGNSQAGAVPDPRLKKHSLEGATRGMGGFSIQVQASKMLRARMLRAFSNLNPRKRHLREQDGSSELATWHLSRVRKNPLDNAKVSWECPTVKEGIPQEDSAHL